MEYQLTAEIVPPAETAGLDPLQQVGVAAMLEARLHAVLSIDGPDGIEIEPMEHSVEANPAGATVNWLLDAPALAFAEDATRSVLEQILVETELLSQWRVTRCAVTATDDQLADVLSIEQDETEVPDDFGGLSEEDLAEHRARLLESATQLQAFGLDAFGHGTEDGPTEEEARLAAGALVQGIELLTDQLFDDIEVLDEDEVTVSEADSLWVLDELPPRYAHHYTVLFAKQFLVATAILGHRLTQPGWTAPWSTAEALALHIAKSKAELQLDLADVPQDTIAALLAAFDEHVFENADHRYLYEADKDGVEDGTEGLSFAEWFHPRRHLTKGESLHPYLADEPGRD